MTIPFTYAIKCRSTGQRYYGVRYAKGCSPSDLWVSYFTSSKHVRKLIETYGLSDFDVQVRRAFETAEEATRWEHRFLKRIDVLNNPEWINYAVGGSLRANTMQVRNKNAFKRGRKRSAAEIVNRKSNYEIVAWTNRDGINKLVRRSDLPYYLSIGFLEGRTDSFQTPKFKAVCASRKGDNNPAFGRSRNDLAERNRNKAGSVWVNDGIKAQQIDKTNLSDYLTRGFVRGRLTYDDAAKAKMREAALARPNKITPEMVEQIKSAKSDGMSNRNIGKQLGISASSVHRYLNI